MKSSMMVIMLGLLGLVSVTHVFCAPEKVIMQLMRTESQFDYYVEQYPAVVVYCYALPEHDQKKEEEIRRVYSILQKNMIAHARDYELAHVKFIAVNRAVGELVALQKEYGFTNNNAYLMFFKHGRAVGMSLLPEAITSQKINALITARRLENTELEPAELKTVRMARQETVEEQEEDQSFDEDASCCEKPTNRCYCENKMCKHCRYKRPISYYDGEADFLMGFDHLYSNSYSPLSGNYWGGTITNPIN